MAIEISASINYVNSIAYGSKNKVESEKAMSEKGKVQAYYEGLCKKFPGISFNTNGGELTCSANKVVVNLSYDCLKKMANDPEFAKEIEWNLSGEVAANSRVHSWAQRDGVELGGRTVTYDADGNRQSSCGGMRTANSSKNNPVAQNKNQSVADQIKKRKKKMEAQIEQQRLKKEEKERQEEWIAKQRAEIKAKSVFTVSGANDDAVKLTQQLVQGLVTGKKDAPGVDLQA